MSENIFYPHPVPPTISSFLAHRMRISEMIEPDDFNNLLYRVTNGIKCQGKFLFTIRKLINMPNVTHKKKKYATYGPKVTKFKIGYPTDGCYFYEITMPSFKLEIDAFYYMMYEYDEILHNKKMNIMSACNFTRNAFEDHTCLGIKCYPGCLKGFLKKIKRNQLRYNYLLGLSKVVPLPEIRMEIIKFLC